MEEHKIPEEKVREERELARLGGELEGLERRLGVWESCKLHRVAVLYGISPVTQVFVQMD